MMKRKVCDRWRLHRAISMFIIAISTFIWSQWHWLHKMRFDSWFHVFYNATFGLVERKCRRTRRESSTRPNRKKAATFGFVARSAKHTPPTNCCLLSVAFHSFNIFFVCTFLFWTSSRRRRGREERCISSRCCGGHPDRVGRDNRQAHFCRLTERSSCGLPRLF